MRNIKSYNEFILEKKKGTVQKMTDLTIKQFTSMGKMQQSVAKNKAINNAIKGGGGDQLAHLQDLLTQVQAQIHGGNAEKAGLKKKELELKTKIENLKKTKD